jgi:hypothetical protein
VLFDDVLTAPGTWADAGRLITTMHVLALGALVAALAAGHHALPAWRERKYGEALFLAALFVAAIGYVAVSSSMRNADVIATKSAYAEHLAKRRADATAAHKTAATDLANAETFATKQRELAAACALKGKGNPCAGPNESRDSADELVRLRKKDVESTRRDLDALRPAAAANAGYAHMARILAAFGAGDVRAIEERLTLLMPFLVVLISEAATVVFLHRAFPAPRIAAPVPLVHTPPALDTPPAPAAIVAQPRPATASIAPPAPPTAHPVLAALSDGRALTNDQLAAAMGVTKGEASKRRREVAHLVTERRIGRYLMIAAL